MNKWRQKHFLIIVAAVALCGLSTFLSGCKSAAEGTQYVGDWVAIEGEYQGQTLSKEELSFSFSLFEDGSSIIKSGTESSAGKWKLANKGIQLLNSNGYPMNMTGMAKYLIWEDNGTKITFEKQ